MSHRTHALLFFLLAAVLGACSATPSNRAEGQETSTGPRTLRVLTYNLHHGEGTDGVLDLERIARLIEGADVDLVALQEVDRGCERTGGVDQLGWLAGRLEMELSFAKFMDYEGGEYGLGVLSRLPIVEAWTIELPPGPREPRAAAAVRVGSGTSDGLVFVSLHFDWLEDDASRLAQAEALVAALAGEREVLIAGDVNDVPGSRTLELLQVSFTSVWAPEPEGATFPSDVPERAIDHVLYRGGAMPQELSAEVLDERVASDHRPVLAELRAFVPAQLPSGGSPDDRP